MSGFYFLLMAGLAAILPGTAMAALALSVGEPFAVMPTPADVRAQVNPVVAYDGKGMYLVVWQQGRLYYQSQSADILAARVDSSGRVLDRQPIIVCNAGASQERPQVAFSGGRFLVVWHDLRNGRDWDVYAARVSPDGRVLEPEGFLVAGGPRNQADPVVAPAADGFLVVWQHYDRHYRLQASKIPLAGAAAPGQALRFGDDALWGGELALTQVGEGWLLSWSDEKNWSKSRGLTTMITRHFARLGGRNGKVNVLDVQRSPSIHLGRDGGRFASDSAATALYASWGLVGRGNRAATAALFGAGPAIPLRNPNPEKAKQGSGWNPERTMTLFDFGVPVDGPIAAAYGQGIYLAAAREAYAGKPGESSRLWGSRLTAAGTRIDLAPAWPLLHESPNRIANPVLAGGNRQFLLAFEQTDADGRRQIWAKILKAK